MNCPRCGSPNKENSVGCYKCGYRFENASGSQTAAGTIWHRDNKPGVPEATSEPDEPLLILDDEESGTYQNTNPNESIYHKSNYEKLKDLPNQTEANVIIPKAKPKPRYKLNRKKFVFSLIFITLATAVVVTLVVLLASFFSGIVRRSRQETLLSNQPATPLIEQMIEKGKSFHRITFYGSDDERVMVHSPQTVLSFSGGEAHLLLDDEDYIPLSTNPEDSIITVQIDATLFRNDGTEVSIQVPSFTIDIPLAPITLVAPTALDITSYETSINVTVKVNPDSNISIGGRNVTENLSSRGVVTENISLNDGAMNYIDVVVECKGYRRNSLSLQVNRPVMEVPITLTGNVKSSTYDGAVLIEGQTIPGATLTTTATLATKTENLTVDPISGTFAFNVKLNRYGENAIEITSTMTDGTNSTLVYRITRNAELESYTKSAWVMEYSQVLLDATNTKGPSHVYLCYATLLETIETNEGDVLYRFDASSAQDGTQILIVEYTGGKALEIGTKYRMYADTIGLYENDPLMAVRFIYKYIPSEVTANPNATPVPGATTQAAVVTPTPKASND